MAGPAGARFNLLWAKPLWARLLWARLLWMVLARGDAHHAGAALS